MERLPKHCWMLLMAASFTSNSLSFNKSVKVWIKLLSVISLPNESANYEKFFAKERRTFQDLSSPAARRVPRVWIWFSSFERCLAIGISDSRHMTLITSYSSWESYLKMGRISWRICCFSNLVANLPRILAHVLLIMGWSSLHNSMNFFLSFSF